MSKLRLGLRSHKSTFDRIGENLIQKDYLYTEIQKKIDEGKHKDQIIKEITIEFNPPQLSITEIERDFSNELSPENLGEYIEVITAPITLIYPTFERLKDKNPYWDIQIVADDFINGQYRIEAREGLCPWVEEEIESILASLRQASIEKVSIIKKTRGKKEWCVYSKKTNRNMGCFDSIKGAKKRLSEIEFFKHKKGQTWIEDAKPGDKVQLDNGEVGDIISVATDKIEIRTPTKTETVWKKQSEQALIGSEVETLEEIVIIVDVFEVIIPKNCNGVITKLVNSKLDEVIVQFDIDDTTIYIIDGENRTEDIGAFEDQFGHYVELSLKDSQYKIVQDKTTLIH